jgi:hypothetical protein
VRAFDLVYCCRLYGETVGFDASLARFWDATGDRVDLAQPDHRELTVAWLRSWGCRNLRVEDTQITLALLADWAGRWQQRLHAVETTLDDLSDKELDVAAAAYEDLAFRPAARRQQGNRLIDVKFGPTAAAKALFAVRPRALAPWDDAIRKALGYDGSAQSYRDALVRARRELNEAVADAGVPAEQLPDLVGRPLSPPPKLIDEHDWVRYAAGHVPPSELELRAWLRLFG